MYSLLWDASALAKRYAPELGSPTVNAMFAAGPRSRMVTTILTYSETYAALLRKYNRGALDQNAFTSSRSALRAEVIDDPDFGVLALGYDDILNGIDLVSRHNLNSSDAAVLMAFLQDAAEKAARTIVSILVASDHRLLRAAQAENLRALNPELLPAADVPSFLAAL
jgi:hypothetical protein